MPNLLEVGQTLVVFRGAAVSKSQGKETSRRTRATGRPMSSPIPMETCSRVRVVELKKASNHHYLLANLNPTDLGLHIMVFDIPFDKCVEAP